MALRQEQHQDCAEDWPPAGHVTWISHQDEVDLLIEGIFDPSRTHPITLITTKGGQTEPSLDPYVILEHVGDGVALAVIKTTEMAWRIAQGLPEGWETWKGAARTFMVGAKRTDVPHSHPIFFPRGKDPMTFFVKCLIKSSQNDVALSNQKGSMPARGEARR